MMVTDHLGNELSHAKTIVRLPGGVSGIAPPPIKSVNCLKVNVKLFV